MGTKINYGSFLKSLDNILEKYFAQYGKFICCKKGCSACCEKGDYPLSNIELEYLMQGYAKLSSDKKMLVQKNINSVEKGGKCPFLTNKECSVYDYRPIICRVHGLAYLINNKVVKVPYCTNEGKNFSEVYKNGEFLAEPIQENLDTSAVLKSFLKNDDFVIKNLYDWIKQ